MRKNKQAEDRLARASALLSGVEALAQHSDRNSGPEEQGELASEVQSFITRRNELARRLNKEIEATEKKLSELRRTKARLFPEGSVEILSEPERQERKPKRTTKAVKTPQDSPDVQPAKEFTSRSELPSHLMIHRIVDELETDNTTGPLADRSGEVAERLASHHLETFVGAGARYLDLGECLRSRPALVFNSGRLVEPLQKFVDLPVVDLLSHEPWSIGRLRPHAMTDRRVDSAPLLAIESGRVLSAVSLGQKRFLMPPRPSGIAYQSPTLATAVPLVARQGVAHFILQPSHDNERENAA